MDVVSKIIKHAKEAPGSSAHGLLLGLDLDGTLEVSNSFPLPHHSNDEDDKSVKSVARYQGSMLRSLKEVQADDSVIGFYQGMTLGSFFNQTLVDTQAIHQEKLRHGGIVIVHDISQTARGNASFRAFRLTRAFLDAYKKSNFSTTSLIDHRLTFSTILEEVPLKIRTNALVSSFLSTLSEASVPPAAQTDPQEQLTWARLPAYEHRQCMAASCWVSTRSKTVATQPHHARTAFEARTLDADFVFMSQSREGIVPLKSYSRDEDKFKLQDNQRWRGIGASESCRDTSAEVTRCGEKPPKAAACAAVLGEELAFATLLSATPSPRPVGKMSFFGASTSSTLVNATGGDKDIEVADPPTDSISSVSFSPTADYLAVGSWDNNVRIYEVGANGQTQGKAMYAHQGPVLSVCWNKYDGVESPQGGVLATGSWDKTIKYWDLRTPNPVSTVQLPERCYTMDVVYPLMVVGTAERHIQVFNLANPTTPFKTLVSPLKWQTRVVSCFPSANGFAVGSIEGRVAIQYVEEKDASNNFSFKCHRRDQSPTTKDQSLVYAVNDISFHPVHGTFSTCGKLRVRWNYQLLGQGRAYASQV
ncbi:hypothetical protein NUW54_g11229 [Trametes sanguinea]|uniref:Uncharacterized protein n=1 Tax=Trametes sanguinea TaxID=158606 RepID=A0ACC1NIV9_9APHY|nr:hypothetical protein NUW54_g11229 [Trametes sanguinea]